MYAADVTERVWSALLAARAGQRPAVASSDWSAGERSAWNLYAPLAHAGAERSFFFAQVGQSLDGRIATVSGDAQDVSGKQGLCHLHRCRALADAVVIGVRTALHDDPRLTVRLVGGQNPARVVIDPAGRLPDDARVLAADGVRRLVVQAVDRPRAAGIEVVRLGAREGWISPVAIRAALAKRGLRRVLIEGGGVTIAGFLEAGLLGRLHVAIAPLIIGAGPSGLSTAPIARLADALRPEMHVYGLGTDVVFDCVLASGGNARTSAWPTVQCVEPVEARRA